MGKFRGLAQNSAFCGKLWSQTIGCQIELNESIRFSGVNRIKSKLFFGKSECTLLETNVWGTFATSFYIYFLIKISWLLQLLI